MRLARDIEFENYTNGKGIRMVIWNQGCKIHCPGCHNPETWNLKDGKDFNLDYLKHKIKEHSKNHSGITLSGGDPFLQPQENKELAIYAHSLGLNVWAYSGQLFEKLKENNIFVRKYFYPLMTELSVYKKFASEMPNAKRLSEGVLCLPLYPTLSQDECKRIVEVICSMEN